MKKLATALAFTLVILGVAATYLWHELGAQREQNSATTRTTAAESAATESSRPATSTLTAPVNAGTQAVAPTAAAAGQAGSGSAAPAARDAASKGINPLLAQVEKFRNSPEGREFERIMARQMLEEKYADVAKALSLRPGQVEKLLDLLAQRDLDQEADEAADEAADKSGRQRGSTQDRAERAERARSREAKSRQYRTELAAVLGDSYPKWDEYQNAVEDRQRATYTRMGQERMRSTISAGGTPLTDAQFEYLNTALAAEQKRIDAETTSVQQQLKSLPETNRRLTEVAAAHLNPQQLDKYRRYLEQQQELITSIEAMGVLPSD